MHLDALGLLRADHSDIGALLFDLAAAPSRRRLLLRLVGVRLRAHLDTEDEILEPFYRRVVAEQGTTPVTLPNSAWLREALAALEREDPRAPAFEERLQVLGDGIVAHADRHERLVFPFLRRHGGADRLREIGKRMRRSRPEYEYEITGVAAAMAPAV